MSGPGAKIRDSGWVGGAPDARSGGNGPMKRLLAGAALTAVMAQGALAQEIGVSMALFDDNFLTVLRNGMQDYAATLDGVIHLAHPGVTDPRVLTETFSLSGILTPAKPISYGSAEPETSNGYGTLAEAGWSLQRPIRGVTHHPAGGLAMARCGEQLALLFQPGAHGRLWMSLGSYGEAGGKLSG